MKRQLPSWWSDITTEASRLRTWAWVHFTQVMGLCTTVGTAASQVTKNWTLQTLARP